MKNIEVVSSAANKGFACFCISYEEAFPPCHAIFLRGNTSCFHGFSGSSRAQWAKYMGHIRQLFSVWMYVCKCSNEIHVYILSTVISMIYIYIYNYVCIHNYIYLHILHIYAHIYIYIYCKTELGIVKLSYEHLGGKQQKLAAHLKTSSLPTPATQKNLPLWIWFCYWNSIAAMVFRKPQQSVVSERNKT